MSFHDVYAWTVAHGPAIAGVLLLALPTVITGLSEYPKAAGVTSFLKVVLNLLSVLTHKDSPGTFKLPLTLSQPPAADLTELKPRGFARLEVLFVVALLSLGAAAAPKPEALANAVASDPGAVQPGADIPPPPTPQFGGCVKNGKICFAPSVALTLAAINMKTKTIEGAFSPGVGYGFTVNPGKWSSFGAAAYFTADPAAQRASGALLLSFFNGYLHVGASKGILGDVAWRIPLALGMGLGF
jgi:hypothetical protein